MHGQRVVVPGSEIKHGDDARWSPAPNDEKLSVTLHLRRKSDLAMSQLQSMSRDEVLDQLSAGEEDLRSVREFVELYGLCVTAENAAARTVSVEGTLQQLALAFEARIGVLEGTSGSCISYEGQLTVPIKLRDSIVAVLGLDGRQVARRASHPGVVMGD